MSNPIEPELQPSGDAASRISALAAEAAYLRAELARVNVCRGDMLPRLTGNQRASAHARTMGGGGFNGESVAQMDAIFARRLAWARDVCPASDARAPW